MTIKRRFIAGAKCPKCEAMDRIVMLSTSDAEWIECIELEGNRFRLTLRGCNADNLAEKTAEITAAVKNGIPNYFGLQRFGGFISSP